MNHNPEQEMSMEDQFCKLKNRLEENLTDDFGLIADIESFFYKSVHYPCPYGNNQCPRCTPRKESAYHKTLRFNFWKSHSEMYGIPSDKLADEIADWWIKEIQIIEEKMSRAEQEMKNISGEAGTFLPSVDVVKLSDSVFAIRGVFNQGTHE